METEITFLQKIEFCAKHKIPLKEFWFHFEIFETKKEEERLRKIFEKARKKKLFQDFLVKSCLKVA